MPGMLRGGARPQSGRASEGEAAAKATRTATKLGYGVTERYGAGYQLATGNKSRENRPILAATQPSASPPATPTPRGCTAPAAAPHSAGPSKNVVQAAATAGLPNKCHLTSKQSTPPASLPAQCARALDHRQSVAFLAIRARTGLFCPAPLPPARPKP